MILDQVGPCWMRMGEEWMGDSYEPQSRIFRKAHDDDQNVSVSAHTTLNLRVSQPELNGPEFAAALSTVLGRDIKPATVRVQLHRAREKFASFLIDNVASSLEDNFVTLSNRN